MARPFRHPPRNHAWLTWMTETENAVALRSLSNRMSEMKNSTCGSSRV